MPSHIPVSNRSETILGSAIAIQVVAIASVAFRLFARYRIVHGLGLDDLFVLLACISTLIGTVFVGFQPANGLGKHLSQITLEQFINYIYYTYAAQATYATSTTFIKISILLQYLRIARRDYVILRRICIFLIVIVSCWGSFFFFAVVFSCTPINAFWNFTAPGRCVMFGSRDPYEKVNTYIAQAASNMTFDVIIFLLPIWFVGSLELSTKGKFGLIGLFSIGAVMGCWSVHFNVWLLLLGFKIFLRKMAAMILCHAQICLGRLWSIRVVGISILRLESMVEHKLGLLPPLLDVTWYAPLTVISTCLEVNVAVLCASIPVFWPVLKQLGWPSIMVVKEVSVRSAPRKKSTAAERSDEEELQLTWDPVKQHSYPMKSSRSVSMSENVPTEP